MASSANSEKFIVSLCGDNEYPEYVIPLNFERTEKESKFFADGYTLENVPGDGSCLFSALHYLYFNPTMAGVKAPTTREIVDSQGMRRMVANAPHMKGLKRIKSGANAEGREVRKLLGDFVTKYESVVVPYMDSRYKFDDSSMQGKKWSAKVFKEVFVGTSRWGSDIEAQIFAVMSDSIVIIITLPDRRTGGFRVRARIFPCKLAVGGIDAYSIDDLNEKRVLILAYDGSHYQAVKTDQIRNLDLVEERAIAKLGGSSKTLPAKSKSAHKEQEKEKDNARDSKIYSDVDSKSDTSSDDVDDGTSSDDDSDTSSDDSDDDAPSLDEILQEIKELQESLKKLRK